MVEIVKLHVSPSSGITKRTNQQSVQKLPSGSSLLLPSLFKLILYLLSTLSFINCPMVLVIYLHFVPAGFIPLHSVLEPLLIYMLCLLILPIIDVPY